MWEGIFYLALSRLVSYDRGLSWSYLWGSRLEFILYVLLGFGSGSEASF